MLRRYGPVYMDREEDSYGPDRVHMDRPPIRAEAQFARNCAKINTEFLKFFASAQKFIRAKIF